MKFILLLFFFYSSSTGADQSEKIKELYIKYYGNVIARYDLKVNTLNIPEVLVDNYGYSSAVTLWEIDFWKYKNKTCYALVFQELGRLNPPSKVVSSFNSKFNLLTVPEVLMSNGSYNHDVMFFRIPDEQLSGFSCYILQSQKSGRKPKTQNYNFLDLLKSYNLLK